MLRSWLSFVELTISRILRTHAVWCLFELLPCIWHFCKGIFFLPHPEKHGLPKTADSCSGAPKQHKHIYIFFPQDCISVSRSHTTTNFYIGHTEYFY